MGNFESGLSLSFMSGRSDFFATYCTRQVCTLESGALDRSAILTYLILRLAYSSILIFLSLYYLALKFPTSARSP